MLVLGLIVFMESEFASWMDRFHLEHPDKVTPDEPDEALELLFARGFRHEANHLHHLRHNGRDVCEIADGTGGFVKAS